MPLVVVMTFALALLPVVGHAKAQPAVGWKDLADCAAAYRANSEIPDPDRAPSMKAMIADQSTDYVAAATQSYRRHAKASEAKAGRSVSEYVARRTQAFSGQPREAIEHLIDACPQVGG